MKILIIGKFDAESFGNHISDALAELEHSVIHFTKGIKYWHFRSSNLNRLNMIKLMGYQFYQSIPFLRNLEFAGLKKVLNDSNNSDIDLVISTHDFLTPTEVEKIKNTTKSPIVLWFPDAIVNFGKAMFLSANYDFLFFKDPYIVYVLRREMKKNIYYLPECCNPHIHKIYDYGEADKAKYCCDITTAGNFYSNRSVVFNQLAEYNFQMKIWGNPPPLWMDTYKIKKYLQGEYLIGSEKGKAFQLGKIVLNNLHPAEIWGINCRAFEIPSLGGFQMVSWRPGISDLFSLGIEIETYKTFDELVEKSKFYLINESKRKEIIDAGHIKARSVHTYQNRVSEMLSIIFSNGDSSFNYNMKNI